MFSPNQKGAVVTILNFQAGQPVPSVPALQLNITLPFKPATISSVEHGQVKQHDVSQKGSEWVIGVTIPLQYADFLLIE